MKTFTGVNDKVKVCNTVSTQEESEVFVVEAGSALAGSIVDTDTQWTQKRYNEVKELGIFSSTVTAWRNDKAVSEIALISVDSILKDVTVTASDLNSGDKIIAASNVTATFVKSAKAYNGKFLEGGDYSRPVPEDNGTNRSESSDILYQTTPIDIPCNSVQPVWIEFKIPKNAEAGTYTGIITVTAEGIRKPITFTYTVNVQNAVLPDAEDFKDGFDIELWQYPYTSAEYYNVTPFSEEHFAVMRSGMEHYKEIGGHSITTSIVEEAWSGQTYSKNLVHYPSMVKWNKQTNGSFDWDYADFDKWVTFCKGMGIGDKIVLYSIAPWNNAIGYWENGTLKYQGFHLENASDQEIWKAFLCDLTEHLMEKGWFDDAYIGIDERGFSKAAFDLIDSVRNIYAVPLKTAGAMDHFTDKRELALRVTDLNIGDNAAAENVAEFKELLAAREAKGYRTTLYSCTGHQPGNFSLSAPVESYWAVLNAGMMKTAGFLRWSYDAWVADPLRDVTHNVFEPGDCFLIFPDEKEAANKTSKTSVRLERMAEGVRDVNKLLLIKKEVPALSKKADAVFEHIQYQLVASNSYLNADGVEQLCRETALFKQALNALTEEYITMKETGIKDVTVDSNHTETVEAAVRKELIIKNELPVYMLDDKYITDIDKPEDPNNQYLGQPDLVRTSTNRLITSYPQGHGKGPLVMQISDDNGATWTKKTDIPKSWAGSQETPTLYVLNMADGRERIMLITACPGWGQDSDGNWYGFNTSYSDDNGNTWTEYKHWYSTLEGNIENHAIVAMASLIHLKDENGNYIDEWMGVFHDYQYRNYKTILSFDKNGNEQWSMPERYLDKYRVIEEKNQMCEIGMFRSPDGKRIVGLARSQSHNNPATLIYSDDEGKTWSEPMDLPGSLAGERHKAVYDPISGRLVITFREIQYDLNNNNKFDGANDWTCNDWGAWVGTYEDLMNQNPGDYRIRIEEDWAQSTKSGDTGYAGLVVLEDGTFIMDSYGHWDKEYSEKWGWGRVTTDLCYIKQAKFKLADVENANNLVDYSDLEEAVEKVEGTAEGNYTAGSWNVFKDALTAAQAMIRDKDVQQIEADAAMEALRGAYNSLTEKQDKYFS